MFRFCLIVATYAVVFRNSLAISDEDKTVIYGELLKIASECYKDIPISENEITDLRDKKVETDQAKCFVACALRKAEVFDDSGVLTPDAALKNIKDKLQADDLETLRNFFNECSKVNSEAVNDGDKGCDRAKLAFDCFTDNADTFGFNLDFKS